MRQDDRQAMVGSMLMLFESKIKFSPSSRVIFISMSSMVREPKPLKVSEKDCGIHATGNGPGAGQAMKGTSG